MTFEQCKEQAFKGWWFKASEEVDELYRQAAELYADSVARDAWDRACEAYEVMLWDMNIDRPIINGTTIKPEYQPK